MKKLLLGTSEIREFSTQGEIYAAPTLIYHCVSVHHYKPPDEFVRALSEGPQPESREYFDRLKELALECNRTSAPTGERFRFERTAHPVGKTNKTNRQG